MSEKELSLSGHTHAVAAESVEENDSVAVAACTGKRTSWFYRRAVGIRCTGSGEFSDGFVNKTNACTKKRMGSATWKTTEKGECFAETLGEEESKSLETEGIDGEGSSLRNES